MHLILLGDNMTRKRRPNFSPEFKLESAQLVVDQNYSVRQAAEAVNVSASSMDKWARQLREVDFPGFARHQIALKCNSMRGVYERQTIHGRIQTGSG